ncbi:MAG: mercury(II) reductase [Sulfobacillus sp.]|nr:mercury(II) reductase [Sulfobacillus sp.]
MEKSVHYIMDIQGMTCTSCEHHVGRALEAAGASNIRVSFRRGQAEFQAPADFSMEKAQQLIVDAGYTPQGVRMTDEKSPERVSFGSADYDLVVIGSGSAAFAAAIEARGAGAKVLMIERGTLGGTCVNVGCVPSKTLLRASEIHHMALHHSFAGLRTTASTPDLGEVVADKDRLVATMRQTKYADLLGEYDIEFLQGEARFVDSAHLRVGDRVIHGGHYLIATGARPRIPDIPGIDTVNYLTSTTALDLTAIPEHLIVVGSGYIALELGQMFRHWGSHVTLIQRGPTLLPGYDAEIRRVMQEVLENEGIRVMTGITYDRVEQKGSQKIVYVTRNGVTEPIIGDQLLVAAGRVPNTEALDLPVAGVQQGDLGQPMVDGTLMTANPRIYAAGDVTLGPQFVYVAAYQGKLAAQNALGLRPSPATVRLDVVPAVTFTQPSLATVGMTEAQAKRAGLSVKTAVLPLDAVPRALANHETRGVFKMVAEAESGRILGVQAVAENAGDVIYAATLAVKFGLTITDLTDTLAPYLTMAEGLKLTALTFDQDVSKLSCCAG